MKPTISLTIIIFVALMSHIRLNAAVLQFSDPSINPNNSELFPNPYDEAGFRIIADLPGSSHANEDFWPDLTVLTGEYLY